jgi:hypothetical protein
MLIFAISESLALKLAGTVKLRGSHSDWNASWSSMVTTGVRDFEEKKRWLQPRFILA